MVSSCKACNNQDSEKMVQCDACDGWFHFDCVGVDEVVEAIPWSCEHCKELGRQDEITKTQARLEELMRVPTRSAAPVRSIESKQAKSTYQKSVSSKSKTSRTLSKGKSKEKRLALLDEELKLKLEHLEKRKAIEEEKSEISDEDDISVVSKKDKKSLITTWMKTNNQRREKVPSISFQPDINDQRYPVDVAKPIGQASTDNIQEAITMKHLSMRQITATNTRKFVGKTEDWPIFISWFRRSSDECNFSEDENLNRLQQCLQGAALDLVKGYLFYPGTLQQVLNVLRNKYGRPEQILHMLNEQLRSHPFVTQERLDSILDFSVTVQHVVGTMKVSGLSSYLNNPILVQELVSKLSGSLKLSWAEFKSSRADIPEDYDRAIFDTPDLATFASWLSQLAGKAGSVAPATFEDRKGENMNRYPEKRNYGVHSVHRSDTTERGSHRQVKCIGCHKESHHLSECQQFLDLQRKQRLDVVRQYNICRKCLGSDHHVTRCKSKVKCGVDGCIFKHHPLLHDSAIHSIPIQHVKNDLEADVYRTFAFLDEGSTTTMIDDKVAQALELDGPISPLCLRWTGDLTRNEFGSRRVSLRISGITPRNQKFEMSDVRTVKSLDLPMQSLNYDSSTSPYKHLRNLPVSEYRNVTPRILIGLNNYKPCLPLQVREGSVGEPMAVKTKLGWTIFGPYQNKEVAGKTTPHYFHSCSCKSDEDLHEQVQKFFSIENFGVKQPSSVLMSKHDQRAIEILDKTTKKVNGQYVSGLLWQYDHIKLPNSFVMAKRRLICLEQKMKREPALAKNLKLQIKDYVSKGYARKLSSNEVLQTTGKTWYLPIFSVTNPNKPGKVRTVWDAAATVDGVSLNSVLLKGPDLLCSLSDILFRFRERPIAISGDIKEMYHQVKIMKEDQQAQRFLWRDGNPNREIDVYVMQVMTFGASCSPSTAHYVKNTNASLFDESNPRAAMAIRNNHYVDDWLDSFKTEEEAITVSKDVLQIHATAGFEIRKFVSNSTRVLEALDVKKSEINDHDVNLDHESIGAKVLGMWWSTKDDVFYFAMNLDRVPHEILNGQRIPTKREVLRTLMMVFDPLGLIACFLVYVKILLQEILRSSVMWDQQITNEQYRKWNVWTQILPKLREIRIPRCYLSQDYTDLEMHVFVDASINAFSAVVFFRFKLGSKSECKLIGAKTKVAPQKPMSIPRLELQAAVLGARLAKTIITSHSIRPNKRFFWSDSIDVLSWLRSDHRRYRQLVAFRVGEILELTHLNEWRWVPTKHNVADEATKWKEQSKLNSRSRWFIGPEFLELPPNEWPTEQVDNQKIKTKEERVKIMVHSECVSNLVPKYERFSKWNRLLRTQAWTLRMFWKAKRKTMSTEQGELVVDEILRAEREIFYQVQSECFKDELFILKNGNGEPIDKSSSIYTLTPFLDKFGVLRVKGRAREVAGATYNAINPIILPNHEQAINEVRQKYAISRLRRGMQKVRSNCQHCKNDRAKPAPPQMASHPLARMATFTAPFSYVGLDYFGPLEVSVGRRTEKRWIALFTCLTIRAVHLEVVYSLTKISCWMAIRNFIARRGMPIEIRSDNGTNFVGVANELSLLYKNMTPDDHRLEFGEIRWLFNPPSAPHTGGCWERMVKSVKISLTKVMPTKRPNDESLRCYPMEAESIVNSRPLTYVSLDTEDEEALTPNHLLLGSSSGRKPLIEFSNDVSVRSNYELSQQMAEHFWRRWIREYLPILTRTTKWFGTVRSIKIGDIVIIMDDKLRDSWQKGKVIDIIKGKKDNQVRHVIIKTPKGVYRRCAAKVAVLDIGKQNSSEKDVLCTEGENVEEVTVDYI